MNRKDEAYRIWIKGQKCAVPGCKDKNIQAHHWRTSTNAGVGIKPDDTWCIPLCFNHHKGDDGIHPTGKLTWAETFWLIGKDELFTADDDATRITRELLERYFWEKHVPMTTTLAMLKGRYDELVFNQSDGLAGPDKRQRDNKNRSEYECHSADRQDGNDA